MTDAGARHKAGLTEGGHIESAAPSDPQSPRTSAGLMYAAARRLPVVLLASAALMEVMTMLMMTVLRYRAQHMPVALLDLTRMSNLVGFLFEAPFIILFTVLTFTRRFHTLPLATLAATTSCIGLAALSVAPDMLEPDGTTSYTGYLVFLGVKAMELGMLITAFRYPRRRLAIRALRSLTAAVGVVATSLFAVVTMVLVSPFGNSITEQPTQEYDAGVILGAAVWSGDRPSPVLRERINRGYDLLKNGTVQFVVLTGGHAPHELPEAEVGRRELLKLGADPTRIVLETHTGSTLEQILFIRDQLMKKQGWKSFVIISDQFHLKRALEICDFNDVKAVGVSSESPLGPQNLAVYHVRESGALILYWLFGA